MLLLSNGSRLRDWIHYREDLTPREALSSSTLSYSRYETSDFFNTSARPRQANFIKRAARERQIILARHKGIIPIKLSLGERWAAFKRPSSCSGAVNLEAFFTIIIKYYSVERSTRYLKKNVLATSIGIYTREKINSSLSQGRILIFATLRSANVDDNIVNNFT